MTGNQFMATIQLCDIFCKVLHKIYSNISFAEVTFSDTEDKILFHVNTKGMTPIYYLRKLVAYLKKELNGIEIDHERHSNGNLDLFTFYIYKKDLFNVITYYRMRGVT